MYSSQKLFLFRRLDKVSAINVLMFLKANSIFFGATSNYFISKDGTFDRVMRALITEGDLDIRYGANIQANIL